MENTKRGAGFEMGEAVLKIAAMMVSLLSTVVKAIDLVDRVKNQRSNRQTHQS